MNFIGQDAALFNCHSKRFIQMRDDKTVGILEDATIHRDNLDSSRTWERFLIVDAGAGSVALFNREHNLFVQMRDGGTLGVLDDPSVHPSISLDSGRTWERFRIVDAGNGKFAFHNDAHNRFIGVYGCSVGAQSGPRDFDKLPSEYEWPSERFEIVPYVGSNHRFVSCDAYDLPLHIHQPFNEEIKEAIDQAPNATNKRFIAYIASQCGKQVGDGICHSLRDYGFDYIGFPPEESAYDIVPIESIAAGDILTFLPTDNPVGYAHVVVVFRVVQRSPSLVVEVLEQNNNGVKVVCQNRYDLSCRSLSISRHRPRASGDPFLPPLRICPPEGYCAWTYNQAFTKEGPVTKSTLEYTFVLMDGVSTRVAIVERCDVDRG